MIRAYFSYLALIAYVVLGLVTTPDAQPAPALRLWPGEQVPDLPSYRRDYAPPKISYPPVRRYEVPDVKPVTPPAVHLDEPPARIAASPPHRSFKRPDPRANEIEKELVALCERVPVEKVCVLLNQFLHDHPETRPQ